MRVKLFSSALDPFQLLMGKEVIPGNLEFPFFAIATFWPKICQFQTKILQNTSKAQNSSLWPILLVKTVIVSIGPVFHPFMKKKNISDFFYPRDSHTLAINVCLE